MAREIGADIWIFDRPRRRGRILAWEVERVTVTHGVVLQRSGNRMLRQSVSWLD